MNLEPEINNQDNIQSFADESENDYYLTPENLNKEQKKFSTNNSIHQFEIFKIIVDTRKFEIENFWKRATFFWGTISILFAAYYSFKIETKYLSLLSLVGTVFSLVFSLSLRGSKYWQESWEHLSANYENQLNKIKLFRWEAIKIIDEENLNEIELLKPRRISVSKLVMILGDFLFLIWLGLLLKDAIFLYQTNEIFNNYKFTKFGCYFLAITIFIFLYIFIFVGNTICKNKYRRNKI